MEKKRRFLVFRHGFLRQERGIVLAVIMMLLVALTGVVAFSARQAVVGEGSARNQMDYELARQAAESALRDAERDILLPGKPTTVPATKCERAAYDRGERFSVLNVKETCPQGQCSERDSTAPPDWGAGENAERWWPFAKGGKWNDDRRIVGPDCVFNGGVPLGTFTGAKEIKGVEYQPEYLMEFFLNREPRMVRVIARGFGMVKGETQVVLQSYMTLPAYTPD
jgi:type IV pilus assembly protein PilX